MAGLGISSVGVYFSFQPLCLGSPPSSCPRVGFRTRRRRRTPRRRSANAADHSQDAVRPGGFHRCRISCSGDFVSNPRAQRHEWDGRADAHREVRRQITVPCRRRRRVWWGWWRWREWWRKRCGDDAAVRRSVVHGPHAALGCITSSRRHQRQGCKRRENCRDNDCEMKNPAPHLQASLGSPRPRLISHLKTRRRAIQRN
jgi:hypothetical protein